MNEDAAGEIASHLRDHLEFEDRDARNVAEGLYIHALRALPDPDALHLVRESNDGAARALLLVRDRLVEVWAFRDDEAQPRVASKSRSLADAGVVVELEWGNREATEHGVGYVTTWIFKFPGEAGVPIRGWVQTMPRPAMDLGEEFARAVAGQVGEIVAPADPPD